MKNKDTKKTILHKNYFLATENALISQNTNRVSIINIMTNIFTTSLPVVVPKIVFVASFNLKKSKNVTVDDKKLAFELVFKDPKGKGLFGLNPASVHELNTNPTKITDARVMFEIITVNFKEAGTYTAQVKVNGQVQAEVEIDIVKGS